MACKTWVKDQDGVVKKVEERSRAFSNSHTNDVKNLS